MTYRGVVIVPMGPLYPGVHLTAIYPIFFKSKLPAPTVFLRNSPLASTALASACRKIRRSAAACALPKMNTILPT